jgi:hypothetical protein
LKEVGYIEGSGLQCHWRELLRKLRLLAHAAEGGTPHSRKVLEGRRANPLDHAYVLEAGPGECLACEFPPARNWLSAHSRAVHAIFQAQLGCKLAVRLMDSRRARWQTRFNGNFPVTISRTAVAVSVPRIEGRPSDDTTNRGCVQRAAGLPH